MICDLSAAERVGACMMVASLASFWKTLWRYWRERATLSREEVLLAAVYYREVSG